MARLPEAQNTRNFLILAGVGHFGAHFFELFFPTLAVTVIRQTGLPLDVVLGWSFLAYLLYGLGALPAELVADRVSPRLFLITAVFGLGVATLAASEALNGRVLSLSLAAMGACASTLHPVGRRLIARGGAARARRLEQLCGNAAIALTPLIIAALCARLGWQPTVRAVGYAVCAVAVACALLPVDEYRAAPTAGAAALSARHGGLLPLASLLAAAALAGIVYCGFTLVLPSYVAGRVSEIGFGAATSLAATGGVAGLYAAEWLAGRFDLRRLYLAFHALSLPAVALMVVLSGLPALGGAGLFLFFSLGMRPIEHALLARYTPSGWERAASAGTFALTYGVGSLAVWLIRWADAAGGLSYALVWLAGVVALVTAAAALFAHLDERGALGRSGRRRAVGAGAGGVVFDTSPTSADPRPAEPASLP